MSRAPALLAAASVALLSACGAPCLDSEPSATTVRFADPAAPLPDFLAHPWPSDARRRPGGNLDLDAFPNPTDSSTLRDYLRVIAQSTRAFGTSAALYASFTGPIDAGSVPADPRVALEDDAPVALIDVDPTSPERGRRYPLLLRSTERSTLYLPAHHLIALPPFGVSLRAGTTYALVLRDGLTSGGEPLAQAKTTNHALLEACVERSPASLAELFAPLRAFLAETESDPEDAALAIAGATVFTTQDAPAELRALAEVARAQPAPVVEAWERVDLRGGLALVKGEVELPGFQAGDRPFAALGDGGELARDAEGRPVVDHLERTRVSFAIPRAASGHLMPEEGWPVVLYSHGTGGSYEGAFERTIADVLGGMGIVVAGYDQTLHGPRDPTGSDPNLTFFNLFNPIAARDNIRQGAADLTAMVNLLSSGVTVPAEITGGAEARFDPKRIAFLGHSQGSLVGAPFLVAEDRVRAVVFSGLGAILTITMLERKDIVDFEGLLESLLDLPDDQGLEDLHPVLNLMQTFIEPADPISYARSYREDPFGGSRFDLLQIEGFKDFASPARGQEAFAAAAGIPSVAPTFRVPPAAELLGVSPVEAPASANVTTPNGAVTFGLIQYPEDTHFPIFENADANTRGMEFLRSALFEGRARIIEGR